jgi:hypothetical protein
MEFDMNIMSLESTLGCIFWFSTISNINMAAVPTFESGRTLTPFKDTRILNGNVFSAAKFL